MEQQERTMQSILVKDVQADISMGQKIADQGRIILDLSSQIEALQKHIQELNSKPAPQNAPS
jgi:hypothetical protein